MQAERSLQLVHCLAASLQRLDHRVWPALVERMQDMMALTGAEGSIRLAGRDLVLTMRNMREVIAIRPH